MKTIRLIISIIIPLLFQGCTDIFNENLGDVNEVKHDESVLKGTVYKDKNGLYYTYIMYPENKIYVMVTEDVKKTNYSKLADDLTIPEKITTPGGISYKVIAIDSDAFKNCKSIKRVKLSNVITEVYDSAFMNSSIQEIVFSTSVRQISKKCFYGCNNLKTIDIPSSVSLISDMAFNNCANLETVTIGNSPQLQFDMPAFANCPNFTTLNFNARTSFCFGSTPNFPSLKNLNIGTNNSYIEVVSKNTFFDCTNLTTLTIGSNVNSIERNAFERSVNIQKVYCRAYNPPSIDDFAFNLIYYNPTHQWIMYKENGEDKETTLIVPKSTIMVYRAAPGWRHFFTITEE